MKYSIEMGLGGMMYVSNFVKIGSGIQKLWEYTQAHRQQDDLQFFKIRKVGYKLCIKSGGELRLYFNNKLNTDPVSLF
jgi:hypothetical protein